MKYTDKTDGRKGQYVTSGGTNSVPIQVYVKESTRRRLKAYAAANGMKMAEVVEQLASQLPPPTSTHLAVSR